MIHFRRGYSAIEMPPALDQIDRQLIGELIVDGRAPYAALAPKVGLSQAAVRARVKRLLDEKTVTVTARVDPRSLGLGVFAFAFLTLDRPARVVGDEVAEIDEAVFVVCLTGRQGLLVEVRCHDNTHLLEVFGRLRSVPGVVDLDSLTVMEYRKSGTSGIAEEILGTKVAMRLAQPLPIDRKLDDIDRILIDELVRDGRATFVDLAPKTGLSQAGVRARVQRLLEEQVVVIQAFPSAEALGLASFATMLISVRGPIDAIAEKLCAMPEFTVVAVTGGRFDVVCEVWCRNYEHLLNTLDIVRGFDDIGVVQSNTYLEILKEDYRLG